MRIRTVREGTPAARAGIKNGDIVVEFDGERVRSVTQFTRLVRETVPGRAVKATVVRDGARQTLNITPEMGRATTGNAGQPHSQSGTRSRQLATEQPVQRTTVPVTPASDGPARGVRSSALDGQLASYFGVKQGVLVTPSRPALPRRRQA